MATIGKEDKFETAVQNLIELDYNAIEAYNSAIDKIDNKEFKEKLKNFKSDHEQHVEELSELLEKHSIEVPQGPDIKQWLTKGKVILAELMGEQAIISAMISNEIDTNAAYENINNRDDMWDDAREILKRGLQEERIHKVWLESIKK